MSIMSAWWGAPLITILRALPEPHSVITLKAKEKEISTPLHFIAQGENGGTVGSFSCIEFLTWSFPDCAAHD